MFKQTKLSMAIIALSLSSTAMAGMYAAPPAPTCVPGDVTVPCEGKKWDLGVRALYLKSLYSGSGANLQNSLLDANHAIDNDWGWGYQLEGSYHFSTGNDISLNWTHYDHDVTRSGLAGNFPAGISALSLRVDNIFDQVNVLMGQHVDMGLRKKARFYAGLQYARIRSEIHNHYATPLPTVLGPEPLRAAVYTETKGVGPVIGIDYSYDLANGFSVTANTASSLLFGNGRYSSQFILSATNLVVPNFSSYAGKKSVIASLEGKLGINYAHALHHGVLNVEAGYQALNYFDALQTRSFSALDQLSDTNFALYGPYFGVKWLGDA
ncbi:MAG: hypothetical protein JJT82_09255 [Legionellaceae bacterium]|nr:hypothetical protein [Legionellaceae bacterium]